VIGVIGECVYYDGLGCIGWMDAYGLFSPATYPLMTFESDDCPPEVDAAAFLALLQAFTDEPTASPTPEPSRSPTDPPTMAPVAIALASSDLTLASDTAAVAIPESCADRSSLGCDACIYGVETSSTHATFNCVYYEPFAGGGECMDSASVWTKLDQIGYTSSNMNKFYYTQCSVGGSRAVSDHKRDHRSVHNARTGRSAEPLGRAMTMEQVMEDFQCNLKIGCDACIEHDDQMAALESLSACVYYGPENSCRSFRGAFDLWDGTNTEDFAFTQCPASGVRSIQDDKMERVAKEFASLMWSSNRGASSVSRLLGEQHRDTRQQHGRW